MSEFRIPTTQWKIDAAAMGIKPGDRLILKGTYRDTLFLNLKGSVEKPIQIVPDGEVTFLASGKGSKVVSAENTQSIVFGDKNGRFIVTGGTHSMDFRLFSTNIELCFVTLKDTGYSGLNIKTDVSCDPKTQSGNFLLQDVNVHDILVDGCLDGEGGYIGLSHFHLPISMSCSGKSVQVKEHEVKNVQVIDSIFRNIGRDGLQLGSCTSGGYIARNRVENTGLKKEYGQASGIQLNPGTLALVEGNIINNCGSYGLIFQGRMGSVARRNLIRNTIGGVFTVARENDPGSFLIENNTFIDISPADGNFMDYYSNTTLKNNLIHMKSGSPIMKMYNGAKLTDTDNKRYTGDVSALKLDSDYVPMAGSSIPAGVGWKDFVKPIPEPPKPTKEVGAVELITTDGIQEWYLTTPSGKRKKIE